MEPKWGKHLHFNFEDAQWLDVLMHKVILGSIFSQVIIFTNNYNNSVIQKNLVFQTIMQKIPTIIIDFGKLFNTVDQKCLKSTRLRYPRTSALYIIFEEESNIYYNDRVENLLKLFIKVVPVPSRPTCLLILFSEKNVCTEDSVRNLLRTSWSLKFLDFTIINVNRENRSVICYYNPFTHMFLHSRIEQTIDLFPDKLKNMNNYTLTVPVYNYPPLMEIIKCHKTNKLKIAGYDFLYVKVFSQKLNFFIKYDICQIDPSDPKFFELMFRKLKTGEINMIGTQFLVGTNLYNNSLIIGKLYSQNEFIILAPFIPISKVHLSLDVFINLFLFVPIVACFIFAVRKLKFPKEQWKSHHIFQLLLGMSRTKMPTKIVHRIIYLNLLFLSMKYSTDAFSKLTDVELVHGHVSFSTSENIKKSGFPLYAPGFIHKQAYNDPSDIIAKLKSNIKFLHQEKCAKMIVKYKNYTCIAPYRSGKYIVDKYTNLYKKRVIQIARITFLHDYLAFAYESGSPFVEKFNELMQKLIETGIPRSWDVPEKPLNFQERGRKETVLLPQLAGILGIGYFLSCVALILEITCKTWSFKNFIKTLLPKKCLF